MAMELAELAAGVVGSFLAPLMSGTETMAKTFGGQLGSSAAGAVTGVAERMWARIRRAFGSQREQDALENFQKDPELYAQPVQTLLEARLQADPELLADLQALIEQQIPGTERNAWQVVGQHVGIVTQHRPIFSGGVQTITAMYVAGDQPSEQPPADDQR